MITITIKRRISVIITRARYLKRIIIMKIIFPYYYVLKIANLILNLLKKKFMRRFTFIYKNISFIRDNENNSTFNFSKFKKMKK